MLLDLWLLFIGKSRDQWHAERKQKMMFRKYNGLKEIGK